MEEMSQIPAFVNLHCCNPLSQTSLALTQSTFFSDEDLLEVPVASHHFYKKVKIPWRSRAPKAVDEDLYKIPQELLYQKPKRNRVLRNLLSGCLGLGYFP